MTAAVLLATALAVRAALPGPTVETAAPDGRRTVPAAAKAEAERHVGIAESYRKRGKQAQAREHFELALRLDPGQARARGGLEGIASASGAGADAVRSALSAAEAAYRESRLADCEGAARRVIELSASPPATTRAKELLSALEAERFRDETTASGDYLHNVRAMYEEGLALHRAGKHRAAAARLAQARSLAPTHAQVRMMDARVRAAVERERAGADAARLADDAAAAEARGDAELALARWRAALAKDPGNPTAEAGVARAASVVASAPETAVAAAFPTAETAASRTRKRPRRRATAGAEPPHVASGSAEGADAPAGPDLAQRRREAERHFRRGMSHFQDGRYAEAKREFEEALYVDPEAARAKEGISRCEAMLAR